MEQDTTDPQAELFISLRARYQALMEIPIGAELIGVAVWFDQLNAIFADAKAAGIRPQEVTHR